jgi:hypothetical protein
MWSALRWVRSWRRTEGGDTRSGIASWLARRGAKPYIHPEQSKGAICGVQRDRCVASKVEEFKASEREREV